MGLINKILKRGVPLLLFLSACSGLTVIEEKDNVNRVVRRATYEDNNISMVEEIVYHESTTRPLQKTYKRLVGNELITFRQEIFKYNRNILRSINYYSYQNTKKILTGKIKYMTKRAVPQKVVYFTLSGIKAGKLFQSGIDLYNYKNNILSTRRIIEYDFNKRTKRTVQISQYVISFENKKIVSIQSSILDKKLNKIITKEEKDSKMISEIVRNINKSLLERAKGVNLLRK